MQTARNKLRPVGWTDAERRDQDDAISNECQPAAPLRPPQPQHAVVVHGDSFEVIHRRRRYGRFTYEWTEDLSGLELLCERRKFGEICTVNQFCADLSDFAMPKPVRCVATIVLGCFVRELGDGRTNPERLLRLRTALDKLGYEKFELLHRLDNSQDDDAVD